MPLVQSVTGTTNGGVSPTPSLTGVTAGNALILFVSGSISDAVPTEANGTWVKPTGGFDSFTGLLNSSVGCYWIQSAAAGTHALTWAGNSDKSNWVLLEWTPLTAVDQAPSAVHTNGTPATLSSNILANANANDVTFAWVCVAGYTGATNSAITDPPSGFTSLYAQQNTAANRGAEFCYQVTSATGNVQATWNFTADGVSGDVNSMIWSLQLGASGSSAALTGNEGTGAVGTLAPAVAVALTNNVGTSSVGTVSSGADVSVALTGNAGTGDVGTVAPALALALTGDGSVAGAAGSVAVLGAGGGGTGAGGLAGGLAVGLSGPLNDALRFALKNQ